MAAMRNLLRWKGLAPEDSNLYYRNQNPGSCHWTRGHRLRNNSTEKSSDFRPRCHMGQSISGLGGGIARTAVGITQSESEKSFNASSRSESEA